MSPLVAIGGIFWVATLIYCVLKDHDERHIWAFVILFLNVPGAALYVVVRVLPSSGLGDLIGARARRNREIQRIEAEIVHLGDRPHLLARLGALKHEAGKNDEAEALLRRAVAADADADYRFDLARVLRARGDPGGAAALLAEIVAKDRNFAYGDALRLFARSLYELGRHDEARPLYEELVRTRPSPEVRYHLAALLEAKGDVAAARAQLERVRLEASAAPSFARRREREWVRQAAALERRIG